MSNPNTNSKLKTLCRTAIFLALLVAVQFVTRSMGQYVTGSLVNLILIASGLLCGLWGGLAVALLSPVCAFLIGIGPAFPQIVPAIMLGNAVIVLVWHLIAGGQNTRLPGYLLAAAAGALAKFAVLYLVIGFYPALAASLGSGGSITEQAWAMLGQSVILLVAVFMSGKFTKAVTGAIA